MPTIGRVAQAGYDESKQSMKMAALEGVSVALVTPWSRGHADFNALQGLMANAVEAGVVGVCTAGTTGEGPRLSRQERVSLTRVASEFLEGSAAVIAGVVTASMADTLDEVRSLAEAGADAVLTTPPTRMPPSQDAVIDFYLQLAESSPVPIIAYHFPALTGVPLEVGTICQFATHDRVIGIKDSSGDLRAHQRLCDALAADEVTDFAVLSGMDGLFVHSLLCGGVGSISASANLVPELSVRIHRRVVAGELENALEDERRLRAIVDACRRGFAPAGWKAALEIVGSAPGELVPPGRGLSSGEYRSLSNALQSLGLIGGRKDGLEAL